MSVLRDRVHATFGVAFGAMWLVAATAKLVKPTAAFELIARAVPPGPSPKLLFAAAIAAETFLGTAMILRAVRGLGWSLAEIVVAGVALLVVRSEMGPNFPCGCFGPLLGTSIDGALLRNAAIVAVHVALIVWGRHGTSSKTSDS